MRNLIRLALQAGNIRDALRLSREARALRAVNEAGGFPDRVRPRDRGTYATDEFMSDPDFAFNERYIDPFSDGNATEFYGQLPQGGSMTFNPRTGARSTQRSGYSNVNELESPFEGVRVWPTVNDPAIGMRRPFSEELPPWMGAGTPPRVYDRIYGNYAGFSPLGFNTSMTGPLPRGAWVGPTGPNDPYDFITDAMGNRWLERGIPF